MESKSDKPKKFKGEDRQLMIKKHFTDKRNKKQSSSSKSDSKNSETLKDSPDSPEKPSEENSEKRPDSRSSPEPNCAICLEPLQNKSFTDSCFHTFCFTCLVEWSKVKPECPLCKQQFKSIVHNVQNDFSYDEYHINSRSTNLWAFCAEQRFRYPTTITPSRIMQRNFESYQDTYHNQIASHRMRFAPHSVRLYSNSQIMSRMPCDFRIRVYTQNLWIRPPTGGRRRIVSPEFFRRNPACTHRLLPWLNRELVALLQNNETQVTFVLELIMALIARYEITSQEFLIHIEPYLGDKTRHFIHELYHFATSPYEMENYDRHADYTDPPNTSENPEDPDIDVIHVVGEGNSNVSSPLISQRRRQAFKSLKKLVLKKNSENNWESVTAPSAQNYSNPGPSTSSSSNYLERPSGSINLVSTIYDSGDDECQVVEVLKPKSERTPEIVDLSSDDEVSQTIIDVPSDSDVSSINTPVSTPRLGYSPDTPSSSQISPLESPFWGSLQRFLPPSPTHLSSPRLLPQPRLRFPSLSPPRLCFPSPSPPMCISPDVWNSPHFPHPLPLCRTPPSTRPAIYSDSSSDIECLYSSEQPSSSSAKENQGLNSGKPIEKEDSSNKSIASTSNNKEREEKDLNVPKKKLSSAIVRPWAMKVEKPREPSPTTSKQKRRTSSSHLDDSLTGSYSDNGTSDDRNSSPKKLKLRSVVAYLSFDSSDKRHDSSHRPSHKKHKDKKKKKKKKHMHKHKHRAHSDSGSS